MLVDVDKDSPDRSSPNPNSHDVREVESIPAHGTNSVNYLSGAGTRSSQVAALNGQFTIVGAIDLTTSSVSAAGPGASSFGNTTVRGATLAHGLGYIPAVIAYYGSSSTIYGGFPSLNYNAGASASALWFTVQASADITNVYIDFCIMQYGRTGTTTLPPLNVRVFFLQQTAN